MLAGPGVSVRRGIGQVGVVDPGLGAARAAEAPSPTAAPFSLSRRREKVFALFFHLFLICRRLSLSFLPRAFLRATVVSRKEKGESEGEEKNSSILLRSWSKMLD